MHQSVERARHPAIAGDSGHRVVGPRRQFVRLTRVIGTAHPYEDLMPLATLIAERIKSNRHGSCCGSFVMGAPNGQLTVRKDSTTAKALLEQHPTWLVGLYAGDTRDGRRAKCPNAAQILGDLRQHFVDIGFVTADHIYEHVQAAEA